MAHFYGTVAGNGSMTSRCGTKASGITGIVQGDHLGVKVVGREEKGEDIFEIYLTNERNIIATFLGEVKLKEGLPVLNKWEQE